MCFSYQMLIELAMADSCFLITAALWCCCVTRFQEGK